MISRSRVLRTLSVIVVVAVAAGLYWFQPWRLLTDREVQDALPALPVAAGSAPAVASPGVASPSVASPSAASTPSPPADRVVAGGAFVSHEHDTRGRAQLVRLADGRHQLVLRDLATSDGPDLRVWLTDRRVQPGRAGWDVFDDGRWVELARLKGNRGNQVYDIPADVALDGLRSVSIWCKRFSVSFGAAALESA